MERIHREVYEVYASLPNDPGFSKRAIFSMDGDDIVVSLLVGDGHPRQIICEERYAAITPASDVADDVLEMLYHRD